MQPTFQRPTLVHNLPLQPTPFVERSEDLLAVTDLLADPACRLLTIVGAGGSGKTRLALESAATYLRVLLTDSPFVDGLYFVNLQPLQSAALLSAAISDAIGYTLAGHEPANTQLCNYLSNKSLLLVLDNFEQLLPDFDGGEHGGNLLSLLLQTAPGLTLLITSREALNLHEEWLYRLGGLSVPGEAAELADLESCGSVRLFVQCARRVRPDFTLAVEAAAVVRICRLVDGSPLALELAASWLRTLDCAAIATEIERNLTFLATNLRNMPERHRSIHAVFAQSWAMLTPAERAVFQRLALFRGGFRRDAAEAVAGATLPILSGLVNKSLLRWEPNGRYSLHELLRQFAEEELRRDPTAAEAILDAHALYFAAFLHNLAEAICGLDQRAAFHAISADLENIRMAWSRMLAGRRYDLLEQSLYTLYQYSDMQGRYQEISDAIGRLVAQIDTHAAPALLAVAHTFLGWTHIRLGQFAAAATAFTGGETGWQTLGQDPPPGFGTEPRLGLALLATIHGDYAQSISLALAACQRHIERNDLQNLAVAQFVLSSAYVGQGDYLAARTQAQQLAALTKAGGNRWMLAYALDLLGEISRVLGEFEAARTYYQLGYFLKEEFNDPEGMAVTLNHLAKLAWLDADYGEAARLYEQSCAIYRRINDRGGLATSLLGLGETALLQQDAASAQHHLHDALQLALAINWWPLVLTILVSAADLLVWRGRVDEARAALSAVLAHPAAKRETCNDAAEQYARLRQDATPCPAPQPATLAAATLALLAAPLPAPANPVEPVGRGPAQSQPLIEPLTGRELEVLGLLAAGLSNQQIADQLILSVGTVKFYTGQIYGKLGVNSRTQAIAQARTLKILAN